MRTLRVSAAGAATCLALASLGAALPTGSASAAGRSALPGSQPAWANATALRSDAPADAVVHLRLYLPWRDAAGLAATAHDVSTPGTARYGKFLTPQQFRAAYAPRSADVAAVQSWLKGQGFTIATVPDSGHFVAVEGTVAQAEAAFGTTLGEYSAYGRTLRAPESAPSVPSSLAGTVSAVVGLDDSPLLQAPDNNQGNGPDQNHGAPGVGFRAGRPCSTYFGEKTVTTTDFTAYGSATKPLAPCGYTPAQVRGLY
ncbi:MAG: protease pro-enzyme activation domain-containing protein, partial [Mycobacteriales bacterium]